MNPQEVATATPQQQVTERLRTAVNVLVTVSNNPSVDQLAAAIGFTLTLNKMGKHATAVFSGEVPSTIEFLKPEATIEKNTDSLRDFIVSLDKSKADKLRYKVEENIVKIFITPYRTSLSEKDLNFSQGDFNVDAVVALGVSEREQLDQAIVAHGRILHDATVITISAGAVNSTLGAINWQESIASSLCEMLVTLAESLQPGLIDNQIATAYLTGIVSQTERFRNDKTTPKIMTMAAQLMAAGANQQLIASELEQVTEVPLQATVTETPTEQPANPNDTADGSLTIDHQDGKQTNVGQESAVDTVEEEPEEEATPEIAIDDQGNMSPAETYLRDKTGRRIIEPLATEPENEQVPEVNEQHPFTANMSADKENEPTSDPLTPQPSTTQPQMMLDHDNDEAIDSAPMVLPQPQVPESLTAPVVPVSPPMDAGLVETLPPAMDNTTLRDIEKTVESQHIVGDPSSTLNEIEEVIDSPHLSQTTTGVVDSARDAVQNAIAATPYDPTRPEPLQALNATAVNLTTEQKQPSSDPVLSSLGLSDNVSTQSVLPPAPTMSSNSSMDPSGQSPPPVPPPLLPVQ